MAKFQNALPTDLIKEFESLNMNTEKMLGEMTKAGAETVYSNVKANAPSEVKDSELMEHLKVSKTYKTPTDGGINNKVLFSGYFTNRNGKKTPVELVLNMFEYGSSKRNYPKRPFFRKSFRKKQIESAMLKVQDKYIKGD